MRGTQLQSTKIAAMGVQKALRSQPLDLACILEAWSLQCVCEVEMPFSSICGRSLLKSTCAQRHKNGCRVVYCQFELWRKI